MSFKYIVVKHIAVFAAEIHVWQFLPAYR